MDLHYKAWLPNVSGRISFSNIRGFRVRGRATTPRTINCLGDDECKWLCSWQKRELSDALFAALRNDSKLGYFTLATIDSSRGAEAPLEGQIVTVADGDIQQCNATISELFAEWRANEPALNESQSCLNLLKTVSSARTVKFIIERNGETTLTFVSENKELADTLVFEAFSCLKDLVHAHKFHRVDEDAIVVPFPIDHLNDQTWVSSTQHNLHGSIVAAYRNARHPADLINAIGRLSYLEAFIDLFGDRLTEPKVRVAHLRNSLQTRLEGVREQDSRHSLFVQVSLPIAIAVLALVIAMTQLLQLPCIKGFTDTSNCRFGTFELDPRAIGFAKEIIESWQTYLYATVLSIAAITVIGYRKHLLRWINDRLGRAGIGGFLMQFLFSAAISSRWGRILATSWVVAFLGTMAFLLFIAGRFLATR